MAIVEHAKVQRNLNNYVGQEVGSFGGRFSKSHQEQVTLFVMVWIDLSATPFHSEYALFFT